MRIALTSVMLALVVGCASSSGTIRVYDGDARGARSVSLLTSACDTLCKDTIKTTFGVKTSLYGLHIMPALIVGVNGKFNEGRVLLDLDVFNNTWNAGYNIETIPGTQKLIMAANEQFGTGNTERVSFASSAGSTYFVGQILDNSGTESGGYRWAPVVVDLGTSKAIYPNGELIWYDE